MKVLFVFGTRPEAIKMCPLIIEMRSRSTFDVGVCVTGQHEEMLKQVLDVFGVVPDFNLHIMKPGQTLFDVTTNVLLGLREVYSTFGPDLVLVHGDTTTTFAAGLAAFYMGIKVGHVEAGLRTFNIFSPFPEEFNRQAVSCLSSFNFAPTETAKRNLLKEGRDPKTICVTGNTAIDALKYTVFKNYSDENLNWAKGHKLILVTAHRRENLGEPLHQMLLAVRDICLKHPDVRVIYPMHKNPAVRSVAEEELGGLSQVRLIEPLDVIAFHNYMNESFLVMTDSGGIQEEAPSLGKPVLVMRDTTERPEGVIAGTLKLVGTNRKNIREACEELLTNEIAYNAMSGKKNPYGDGQASKRICDYLEKVGKKRE